MTASELAQIGEHPIIVLHHGKIGRVVTCYLTEHDIDLGVRLLSGGPLYVVALSQVVHRGCGILAQLYTEQALN
jgi:hypothetical protein